MAATKSVTKLIQVLAGNGIKRVVWGWVGIAGLLLFLKPLWLPTPGAVTYAWVAILGYQGALMLFVAGSEASLGKRIEKWISCCWGGVLAATPVIIIEQFYHLTPMGERLYGYGNSAALFAVLSSGLGLAGWLKWRKPASPLAGLLLGTGLAGSLLGGGFVLLGVFPNVSGVGLTFGLIAIAVGLFTAGLRPNEWVPIELMVLTFREIPGRLVGFSRGAGGFAWGGLRVFRRTFRLSLPPFRLLAVEIEGDRAKEVADATLEQWKTAMTSPPLEVEVHCDKADRVAVRITHRRPDGRPLVVLWDAEWSRHQEGLQIALRADWRTPLTWKIARQLFWFPGYFPLQSYREAEFRKCALRWCLFPVLAVVGLVVFLRPDGYAWATINLLCYNHAVVVVRVWNWKDC